MANLILMRHGQSQWNLMNLFTGWVDVPLTSVGIDEALSGGKLIKEEQIDVIFTSTLIRAKMTALLAMSENHTKKVPIITHDENQPIEKASHIFSQTTLNQIIPITCAWQLNERMYGELQGLNKHEVAEKFGAEQVLQWRRSYDCPPPGGESLQMTAARTLPFFEDSVVPCLDKGQNVFLVAHGNSLRSIIMKIKNLSPEEVLHLELATGLPMIYHYDNQIFTFNESF